MLLQNVALCENAAHMGIYVEYKFTRIHTLYNQGDWQVGKTQRKLFYCQQTSTALICNIKQPHKGAEIKCHDRALNDNSSCQHRFLSVSIEAACRCKQTMSLDTQCQHSFHGNQQCGPHYPADVPINVQ